jgi:protein FRG1
MPDEKVRSTKLKFKGEKTKKKRKREADDEPSSSSRRRRDDDEQGPDTWVHPEHPTDIRGPTFMYHPSDPSPISVTYDATRAKLVLLAMAKEVKNEDEEPVAMPNRVPSDVSQVWVVTRVAGSTTINL